MMKYKIDIAPLVDYFVVVAKDKETDELKETFTLNESAADMLKLMCEHDDLDEVAREMASIYDAPIELVAKDVQTFADFLKQKNIF